VLEQGAITEESQNDPFTAGDRCSAMDKDLRHHRQNLTRPHRDLDPKLREAEFSPSPGTQWDNPRQGMAIVVEVEMQNLRGTLFGCDGEENPPEIQSRAGLEL